MVLYSVGSYNNLFILTEKAQAIGKALEIIIEFTLLVNINKSTICGRQRLAVAAFRKFYVEKGV